MKTLTQKVIVERNPSPLYRNKYQPYPMEKSHQTANSKGDFSSSKGDSKWINETQKVIESTQKVIISLVKICLTTVYPTGKHLKICYKRIKTTTGRISPSKGDNKQPKQPNYHFLSNKRRSLREQIYFPCGALLLKRKSRVGTQKVIVGKGIAFLTQKVTVCLSAGFH